MRLFSSDYKFSCKFKSPTMGEGDLSCTVNIGWLRSEKEALEQVQNELTIRCADAKIIIDTVKFELI